MLTVTDQLGESVTINGPAKRIVTLVPSQTQLLHYFNLDEEVVGISKFCIHPEEWFRSKIRVGGTKTVDIDKVKDLSPDLIIGNKEENTKEDIEALKQIAPVWMSDVNTLDEAFDMILQLGVITGREEKSSELVDQVKDRFNELKESINEVPRAKKSVLYFIWKDPNYVAGQSTFINSMIRAMGLKNVISEDRYPELTDNSLSPDMVFLSTEPYPFKKEDIVTYQKMFPRAEIKIVDGEMFSWYGSKLLDAPDYFRSLLM